MSEKTKLRPILDGEFWLIGINPDSNELIRDGQLTEGPVTDPQPECVDHHIFQSSDGAWRLWGCIRQTPVGRILYHWEADSLTRSPWRKTGQIIRADHEAGECLNERRGEEFLQSPFIVKDGNRYYMFYGGHSSGLDADGNSVPRDDPRTAGQICLMTSADGRTWTRHRNADGYSRLFLGPGETRDPCLLKINGLWHMYYAGYHDDDRLRTGFYGRTSPDLLDWSDWRLVHHDLQYGGGQWGCECPHVVYRDGYYYLFRTEEYTTAKTHVFRSQDPFDFGLGNASDKYVGMIPVAAPEIIVDNDGVEYITSNHDLQGGTHLCRLKWERV